MGIGIVTAESTISVNLSLCISAFTAEVYALMEAVKKVISGQHKKSLIYTDSLSALKALHWKSECEPLLGDILNKAVINSGATICFCWVTPEYLVMQRPMNAFLWWCRN